MKRIIIADDKGAMREMLTQAFDTREYEVTAVSDGSEAVAQAESGVDLVITDLRMPGLDGLEVLRAYKRISPETEVIVMTAFGTVENAVEAMRQGAYDYILKPFSIDEIELKVARALDRKQLAGQVRYLKEEEDRRSGTMIGESSPMRQVQRLIDKVAASNAPVLVLGESGTGKELVAREIHRRSPRAGGAFVAVNCAALSEGLLESELFGHEKGAYTGAAGMRKGRFELADSGTLFLDEIGELSPAIQVKLLRFLQEKEFERVGGSKTIRVDVRVVAATHRNLKQQLAEGKFREDLYYRLNVISIEMPPLRARREDIPALAEHFLARYGKEMAKPVTMSHAVADALTRYHWPGNIRELQNVVERAVVLCDGPELDLADLPRELFSTPPTGHVEAEAPEADTGYPVSATAAMAVSASPDHPLDLTTHLDALERGIILEALGRYRWNQTKVAQTLGLKRSSLQYKMKKHGLGGDEGE
ncbi:MAG: sigma-54 dependent transcriptional regulator [Nitrospirota bacterium]|nr:sigma-54 dependent transcriptional regulator [Nitrospirota bacterium]